VNLIKFDLSVFELLQAYAEQDRSMEWLQYMLHGASNMPQKADTNVIIMK
jgi:hypothetical protein